MGICTRTLTLTLAALLVSTSLAPDASASEGWHKIMADAEFTDRKGVLRRPSCSGGPELVTTSLGDVPEKADTQYAFFIRHGDPHKLAILFDGGGACWDPNTCVASATLGIPTYSVKVDETINDLENTEGIGDYNNPGNPIAGYTQVFIPYCTGDLHTGSNDQLYTASLPDGSVVEWLIHHRGYDNVAFVLEWLADYYQTEVGSPPGDVFVAGASAGGYGALYGYPAVADLLPWQTRMRVLIDAANGVITQDFYDRALAPGGAWRAWKNLAPVLESAFASGPDELVIRIFENLGSAYPGTRFGQYTTAFDATQIFFYNVARNTDDIALWFDGAELVVAGLEWTVKARTYMILSAFSNWNYRNYLAKGAEHTIIASDEFYSEDTAGGIDFVDWLDDMLNRYWPWGSDWRNVSCTPNCLP